MDKNKIPKGTYCYDDNGYCPYHRDEPTIKADFYGFGFMESVTCDYLKLNSAALDFKGRYEKNGALCYQGHLLNDLCKICGVNR